MGCTNFLYLTCRANKRRRPKMAKKRTTRTLRTNPLQMTIPGPAYHIELMMKQVSEKSHSITNCWLGRVGIFFKENEKLKM